MARYFRCTIHWSASVLLMLGMMMGMSAARASDISPTFSVDRLKRDTRILSSDAYEGRAPLSAGEDKAIAYISWAMHEAGLKPGAHGSFLQPVPLVQTETLASPTPRFEVTGNAKAVAFSYGKDVTLNTRRNLSQVTLAGTDVVFVGYGIHAPEHHWNDYEGVDVHGKTVLILVNDPDWQNPLGVGAFGGAAMTYYGRWTYKYEEAARQGAAAAIIVHSDASAGYPFSVLTSSLSGPRVSLDHTNEPLLVEAWITHAGAEKLMALAGENLDQLTKAAGTPGFRARPLGIAAKFDFKVNARTGMSNNVVGVLPGKSHPNEYVLYTAHWDHLGHCRPDDTGDDICNGAIDNASGVAGLLELARAFHRRGSAGRSVIFMATTGEEYGLLGSQYYATHPIYPLADTVADIDIDPLSYMLGATKDISLVADQTELARIVREAATAQGRIVTPDTLPEAGMRYRSDTLSFSRAGLPVVLLGNGIDVIGKPPGWGSKKLDDYVTHRYHQPSDAYDPQWDWSGAVQDLGLYFGIGLRLANGRDWPNWFVNDEFRVARDAVLKATCAEEVNEKSARLSTGASSVSRCISP